MHVFHELHPELEAVELYATSSIARGENGSGVDVQEARVPRDDAIADAKGRGNRRRGLGIRGMRQKLRLDGVDGGVRRFARLAPRGSRRGTEFGVRGRRRVDDHRLPLGANGPAPTLQPDAFLSQKRKAQSPRFPQRASNCRPVLLRKRTRVGQPEVLQERPVPEPRDEPRSIDGRVEVFREDPTTARRGLRDAKESERRRRRGRRPGDIPVRHRHLSTTASSSSVSARRVRDRAELRHAGRLDVALGARRIRRRDPRPEDASVASI